MSNIRAINPELKNKLDTSSGPQYWRSLQELAGSEEFQEYLHREFPENASEWFDPVSRRNFLKIMGASLALAGLTACTKQPEEKIVPYVRQPEELIPGRPLFFATAMTLGGYANGLLMENQMGRPTKAEGNPDHPASLGATDVFGQASILSMYDPDRSQSTTNVGNISSWTEFFQILNLRMQIEKQRPNPGSGFRLLTETITSPSLANQIRELLKTLPGAKWHQYEPLNRDNAMEGARLAFGEPVETLYKFDQADVVLSLDADFMSHNPGHLRYIRDFISRRKVRSGADNSKMSRLYVVESTPSITGAVSDHRLALRSTNILEFAKAIAAGVGIAGSSTYSHPWIGPLVRDLQAHKGTSIVIAGEYQPPALHAIAHAVNGALGNNGKTVIYTNPVVAEVVNQQNSLRELIIDMHKGTVDTLVILGGNPVYNAPSDFNIEDALSKVSLRIHLSMDHNETSNLCHWHIPETHFLESWGDARAFDGTVSLIQPLIAPLYEGSKSAHEIIAALTGVSAIKSHDIVHDYWKTQTPQPDFERFWEKALHDGVIPNTTSPVKNVTAKTDFTGYNNIAAKEDSSWELIVRPDSNTYDGRFANNGWLQELPRPLSKITWDNAALISPAAAKKLQVENEDVVELKLGNSSIEAPVWIMPGQAEDCVTIHLGYGRKLAGHVGNNVGFNAYQLHTSNSTWNTPGLSVTKVSGHYPISTTQEHQVMEGRDIVRSYSMEEFLKHPHEKHEELTSLYPAYEYKGYAWGMAIDLNSCVACNACVIACVAENNIPVVGKREVKRGREMHWLRIDRYYEGSVNAPKIHHQPIPCMHCEDAPCELVCPVNATNHSAEGLNQMVYNRCVGTRYCSNNCPYKVRRFNFFLYSDLKTPSIQLGRNPDVTVRTRGVMEKCTYCVQRINEAKIDAEREDRRIKDGEVLTACQQACPAEAIVFGDINDKESKVAKLKADQLLNYALLEELNTRPRTTYLANVRNLNPEIKG